MKLPIQYALTYPARIDSTFERVDFMRYNTLTFEAPDKTKFRNLAFAYQAMEQGGNMPCVLNAANEVVVKAFLEGKIGFLQMSDIMESVMAKMPFVAEPTYEDYVTCDNETRRYTSEYITL